MPQEPNISRDKPTVNRRENWHKLKPTDDFNWPDWLQKIPASRYREWLNSKAYADWMKVKEPKQEK
jgi:hypothetical protein